VSYKYAIRAKNRRRTYPRWVHEIDPLASNDPSYPVGRVVRSATRYLVFGDTAIRGVVIFNNGTIFRVRWDVTNRISTHRCDHERRRWKALNMGKAYGMTDTMLAHYALDRISAGQKWYKRVTVNVDPAKDGEDRTGAAIIKMVRPVEHIVVDFKLLEAKIAAESKSPTFCGVSTESAQSFLIGKPNTAPVEVVAKAPDAPKVPKERKCWICGAVGWCKCGYGPEHSHGSDCVW
jgi:hypothetical protein